MSSNLRPQPLNYSTPRSEQFQRSLPVRMIGFLLLLVGVPLAGIGLAIIVFDALQGWMERSAVVFFLVGSGMCLLGVRLQAPGKRRTS